MADWKNDPEVQEAITRAREIAAILALPDEETARARLAARGLFPVSVAHGELDSDQAVELITDRMAGSLSGLAAATRAAATMPPRTCSRHMTQRWTSWPK